MGAKAQRKSRTSGAIDSDAVLGALGKGKGGKGKKSKGKGKVKESVTPRVILRMLRR